MFRNDSTLLRSPVKYRAFNRAHHLTHPQIRARPSLKLLCPAPVDFYVIAVLDEMEELHVIECILMIFRVGFHGYQANSLTEYNFLLTDLLSSV